MKIHAKFDCLRTATSDEGNYNSLILTIASNKGKFGPANSVFKLTKLTQLHNLRNKVEEYEPAFRGEGPKELLSGPDPAEATQ